jgi:hypothetical protein
MQGRHRGRPPPPPGLRPVRRRARSSLSGPTGTRQQGLGAGAGGDGRMGRSSRAAGAPRNAMQCNAVPAAPMAVPAAPMAVPAAPMAVPAAPMERSTLHSQHAAASAPRGGGWPPHGLRMAAAPCTSAAGAVPSTSQPHAGQSRAGRMHAAQNTWPHGCAAAGSWYRLLHSMHWSSPSLRPPLVPAGPGGGDARQGLLCFGRGCMGAHAACGASRVAPGHLCCAGCARWAARHLPHVRPTCTAAKAVRARRRLLRLAARRGRDGGRRHVGSVGVSVCRRRTARQRRRCCACSKRASLTAGAGGSPAEGAGHSVRPAVPRLRWVATNGAFQKCDGVRQEGFVLQEYRLMKGAGSFNSSLIYSRPRLLYRPWLQSHAIRQPG